MKKLGLSSTCPTRRSTRSSTRGTPTAAARSTSRSCRRCSAAAAAARRRWRRRARRWRRAGMARPNPTWQTLPSRPRTQRPRQSSRAGRGRRTARRAAPRFCLDFDARTSTTTALTVHDDSILRSPRLLRDGTSTLMYSAAVVCGGIRLSKARCQRMLVRESSDVGCRSHAGCLRGSDRWRPVEVF